LKSVYKEKRVKYIGNYLDLYIRRDKRNSFATLSRPFRIYTSIKIFLSFKRGLVSHDATSISKLQDRVIRDCAHKLNV